ncbi:MAG: GGDEF domain-containing protein [Oscillospiraceae bacterium]
MDEEQRARMTERIQTTLSAPVVLDGKELSVGVSCGCACYPEDGDASQVRITADSRMYETKPAPSRKTTGRRESHETPDPAPRRGDGSSCC